MATNPMTTTAQYLYPEAIDKLTDSTATYASGFPNFLNDVYDNWYSDPLTTGQTPWQTQAWGQAMGNIANPWIDQINQAHGTLGQTLGAVNPNVDAANANQLDAMGFSGRMDDVSNPFYTQAHSLYSSNSSFNRPGLDQFLNPYTQSAADATVQGINRNLTENLLPAVNSTFTGNGQFGSTRNAEFINRALRDTQAETAKALASANYGAYNTANQQYADWANRGLTAGQNLTNLGTSQANILNQQTGNALTNAGIDDSQASLFASLYPNLANTQSNISSTGYNTSLGGLNAMTAAANAQQQQQQQGLTTSYQDWLTRQQFPISALGGLGQAAGNIGRIEQPNVNTPNAKTDDITKYLALAQLLQGGLNDSNITGFLGSLFSGLGSTGG